MRGLPTPAERAAAPKRKRVHMTISVDTYELIRAAALARGFGLGEALDDLLSP
jgi:hypothetical protein